MIRHSLLLLIIFIISVPSVKAGQIRELPEPKVVQRVGRCALLQAGPAKVLLLQGTPYQMGYAHGRLLAADVQATAMRVIMLSQAADFAKKKAPGSTLQEIYRRTLPYVPARFREELAGLADGAGLNRGMVELVNLFPEMFHCSGFSVYGKATNDGKLLHGRVLDYMVGTGLQNYAVVIAYRPVGGNTILTGGYAGLVGCITGLNDRQISMGQMGMGGEGDWDGEPMAYLFRQALEDCNSLDEVLNLFKRTRRTCGHAYVVSDAKIPAAAAIESRPDLLEIAFAGRPHSRWPVAIENAAVISKGSRYENLTQRIKDNFGKIDVDTAIEMIKIPVAMTSNLQDAVMVPADGTMYLSNAGSLLQGKNFQACYQPYDKHELKTYVRILDTLAKEPPTAPDHIALSTVKPPSTQPVKTP